MEKAESIPLEKRKGRMDGGNEEDPG